MILLLLSLSAILSAQAPDGPALYSKHCARCHETDQTGWAVRRSVLSHLPPEAILAQLHLGFMSMLASLTDDEKRALASYISGKPAPVFRMPEAPKPEGLCASAGSAPGAGWLNGPRWNGWGGDLENRRFQPAAMAQLLPEEIPRLQLKWAFAFPLAIAAWSQPVVAGGRVFVGSMNGAVYSLDANTGCTHWIYTASPTGVRSAVVIGPGTGESMFAAYFGDLTGAVHAVDAWSGKRLWKTQLDDHPLARITGSPQLVDGKLYVPVASLEEAAAGNPKYECCTFRGSLAALDAATGKQLWKTYMIPAKPRPTRKTSAGTQMWGPSGAGLWAAPTVDRKRGLLYVATGDHYTDPEEGWGVSVVAVEMSGGRIAWAQKLLKGDRWNGGCTAADKLNCPDKAGPDHDFGASPILQTAASGKQLLLAGQKSGMLHFLDPDKRGAVVRQVRLSNGGLLGGIEWGPAADQDRIYVAISDLDFNRAAAGGGVTALQIATGEKTWHTPAPKPTCVDTPPCSAAQPAAVTLVPGALFSGSLDGHLRAYATDSGKLLWDLDTRKPYPKTVNRVPGRGGSLNAAGATIVGGTLYVNSGYGVFNGSAGNVLLAFTVDGK